MTRFASEYAGALYSLARDMGIRQEVMEDVAAFRTLLENNPAYLKLLCARNLEAEERKRLLDRALANRVQPCLLNFLKLLIDRGRIDNLNECLDGFRSLYNEEMGIEEARVVSAVPLTAAQKAAVREKMEKLTGKSVTLRCEVDPSLIGGLRVEIGGKRYDNSVQTRLNDIRRNLTGGERRKD